MSNSALLRVQRDGRVATVTLNRPEQRNAISIAMLREMTVAFADLGADGETRAIVLAGEGDHFREHFRHLCHHRRPIGLRRERQQRASV